MGQTTLKDLARQLGLSASTVSRALRDHPDISDATKKRVAAMAAKTNYQPNLIAQSLQNRSSNNIGVIVPEIRNRFFSSAIGGIEEVCYEAGLTIMVCQSNENQEREVQNTRALIANRVAGFLVSVSQQTSTYDHLRQILAQGTPLVLFDRVVDAIEASKVIVDDYAGAYGAVCHLIDRGYRRIAHIAGPATVSISRRRRDGYLQALADRGMASAEEWIVYGGYHEEDGRAGIQRLLAVSPRPDAVFAVNDPVAIGALFQLREQGLRIPEDMALVGFTDDPVASVVQPPLTTVHQPAFSMGRLAAQLLLEQLHSSGTFVPRTEVLETELVVRASA